VLAADDLAIRSLHLIAAAVWAGGMVFLGLAVGAARRTVADRERIALFRQLGRRFLVAGGISLAVLIATGIDMASERLASFGDLFDTDYGKRLAEKLALVIAVIVLTAFHSLVQGPALSRLREQALERLDDAEIAATIRRKSARAGVVSVLNLLATLAILVLAARLVTG
jgi:putative copper resistance protein D